MSKEVKVNAEGKELVLRNSAGDYAIIPKNRRAEALKMLEDKCYGCLDALVASLPKTSNEGEKEASKKVEYAQEGLEVEEEEISEEVSFGEAFAKARREKGAGQTFEWRGGTYSTNYEIEPEETQREAIDPVEVTAEAETVTSSTPAPEEEVDTTLSTLELQPLDTSSPEVEEESIVEEVVTEDIEEVVPSPVEDPILDEFSEEDEVGDKRSFSEAFREARERLGAGQTFEWRGERYGTDYEDEVGGAGIEFSDESIEGGDIQVHIDRAAEEFEGMSDSEAFKVYVNTYPERFGATETSRKLIDDTMKKFNEHQVKKISNKSEEEIVDIVDKAMEEFEGVSDSEAFKLYVNTYPEEFGLRETSPELIEEAMEKFNDIMAKRNRREGVEEGAIETMAEEIERGVSGTAPEGILN